MRGEPEYTIWKPIIKNPEYQTPIKEFSFMHSLLGFFFFL